MIIEVRSIPEDEVVWTGSLFEWLKSNHDGFSRLEKGVVIHTLIEKGVYSEGAGACAGFELRRVSK